MKNVYKTSERVNVQILLDKELMNEIVTNDPPKDSAKREFIDFWQLRWSGVGIGYIFKKLYPNEQEYYMVLDARNRDDKLEVTFKLPTKQKADQFMLVFGGDEI